MEELISALEDLEVSLRNMQEHLRSEEWESKEAGSAATDVIIYAGMTARAVERLRGLLVPPGETKVEPAQPAEEEEGGEDLGEQVSEPEDREAGDTPPVQEPEENAPESD